MRITVPPDPQDLAVNLIQPPKSDETSCSGVLSTHAIQYSVSGQLVHLQPASVGGLWYTGPRCNCMHNAEEEVTAPRCLVLCHSSMRRTADVWRCCASRLCHPAADALKASGETEGGREAGERGGSIMELVMARALRYGPRIAWHEPWPVSLHPSIPTHEPRPPGSLPR